jgi:hypothetical protein
MPLPCDPLMSDRGESYADGGFANQQVHYPDPAVIAFYHSIWPGAGPDDAADTGPTDG